MDYWDSFVESSLEFWRMVPRDAWNDYETLQKEYSWNPFARVRMKELGYEENERYNEDFYRNTGRNPKDNTYPIRSGAYGNYVGLADYFEVGESLLDFYRF